MPNHKMNLRSMLILLVAAVALYWIVLDTERAQIFLGNIWGLFTPFITGAAIAFVFNVPMRAVERHMEWIHQPGLRRFLAIVLTLVFFVAAVAFIFFLLIPQIRLTVESIVATLPDFITRETNNMLSFLEQNPEIRNWILEYTQMESIEWGTLIQKVATFAGESLTKLFGGAFTAIGGVTNFFVNAFLAVCFAFYSLARKEILAGQSRRLIYALLPEKWADEIVRVMRLTNTTFSNFISGQCLEACILGSMFAVSMALLDLPYIPLVSVIIAVTALVPLVGAFVGCLLGALFILVESPVQAFTFVLLFLVLQQVEGNLIYPRVVGTSIGLPGMWVLVALSIGGEIGGVAGMLVMIPLASVIYALIGEFTRYQIQKKGVDPEKLEAQPPDVRSKFRVRRAKKREQRLMKRMKELAAHHSQNQNTEE